MEFLDSFYDWFPSWQFALSALLIVWFVLGYAGAPLWIWVLAGFTFLHFVGAPVWLGVGFAVLSAIFLIPPIRRVLSGGVMKAMNSLGFLPAISKTEREAIDAGTVWVEGELFSGKPDFKRILAEDYPGLTEEEQAFLDGPGEEICRLTNDWEVYQKRDLPDRVWDFLKKERFFGLMIPKEYGGLGFSPMANSAIVGKLGTVSPVLGTTVMVPNSLGPAELLTHYGTQEQKDYYLPRLAIGDEVPCFALTEPEAGSDAGAMQSSGEVFKGDDGKLYLKLNWNKRYITLAGVSSLLGIAFKCQDPDNLLGLGTHLGITCALVPRDTDGVILGRRHDPLGIPFWNCPTEGIDVVVELDKAVIGGREKVGMGWRMLMESLSAGRGISLPASSTFGLKYVTRVASAHAVNRKQFGLSIGKFEGIEEPLARLGGFSYLLEAMRRYTLGGLSKGAKPAVVTAMAKYNSTELFRKGINDSMDILGGNAISKGPRNAIAHAYINTPVAITVEGANILTRTLMVFGQGAIRCHPYALKEINAVEDNDNKAFDGAFWSHIGHVHRNLFRSIGLSLTRGWLSRSPIGGPSAQYIRKLNWASSSFALLADLAMGSLGGNLKRKEKLTGRFADVFSWMYIASATIKRFESEGRLKEDEVFFHWSMQYALNQIQLSFEGLFQNLKIPGLGLLFRGPITWWSRLNSLGKLPNDRTGQKIAKALMIDGEQRDRITGGVYAPLDRENPLGRMEHSFRLVQKAGLISKKIKIAVKQGQLEKLPVSELLALAIEKGIINQDEAALLAKAETARLDAITVDSFSIEEYNRSGDQSYQVNPGGDGQGSMDLAEFEASKEG